jgi:hypothetical protein
MPSGKRSKQQRQAKPPPVQSKGGSRQGFNVSRRTLIIVAVVVVVLIGLGVGLAVGLGGSSGSSGTNTVSSKNLVPAPPLGPPGPEGPPLETGPNLAPAGSPSPGQSVDGIQCQGGEQVAEHTHSRLTVFVNGKSEKVPYGVGIADPQLQQGIGLPFVVSGSCFSWLHTHTTDGVIHTEAPLQHTYTLGNFFDVWGQPLSSTQAGPAKGPVTAFLNGKQWTGDPRNIPLAAHAQVQLDVGTPLVAPVHIPQSAWGNL